MADILPRELPAASTVAPTGSLIVDNGVVVEKATPLQITNADARLLKVPDGEAALPMDSLATAEGQVLAVINGRIRPIDNDPAGAEQARDEAVAAAQAASEDAVQTAADRVAVAADRAIVEDIAEFSARVIPLTQTEYDNLPSYETATLYVITQNA